MASWPIPVAVVLGDFCTAEMNLIHSEGKTGLENCFTHFILYFLVIFLLNIHCFGDGGLFFEVFSSFNRTETKGNSKNYHKRVFLKSLLLSVALICTEPIPLDLFLGRDTIVSSDPANN